MCSQAINTTAIPNGPFLTSSSPTGLEDQYLSFLFIHPAILVVEVLTSAAFPSSVATQGELHAAKSSHLQTMRSNLQLVF